MQDFILEGVLYTLIVILSIKILKYRKLSENKKKPLTLSEMILGIIILKVLLFYVLVHHGMLLTHH